MIKNSRRSVRPIRALTRFAFLKIKRIIRKTKFVFWFPIPALVLISFFNPPLTESRAIWFYALLTPFLIGFYFLAKKFLIHTAPSKHIAILSPLFAIIILVLSVYFIERISDSFHLALTTSMLFLGSLGFYFRWKDRRTASFMRVHLPGKVFAISWLFTLVIALIILDHDFKKYGALTNYEHDSDIIFTIFFRLFYMEYRVAKEVLTIILSFYFVLLCAVTVKEYIGNKDRPIMFFTGLISIGVYFFAPQLVNLTFLVFSSLIIFKEIFEHKKKQYIFPLLLIAGVFLI